MGAHIWRWLTSVRLALALIVILAVMSAAGTLVGRQIFGSARFIAVVVLFLLNTACCTWLQVQRAWTRWQAQPDPRTHRERRTLQADLEVGRAADAVAALLGIRRYTVQRRDEEGAVHLLGRKRFWAIWGSPVFHVGLILVIIGGFASLTMTTRGFFGLNEGETFRDRPEEYVRVEKGRLALGGQGRFELRLDGVTISANEKDGVRDVGATVQLAQDGKVISGSTVDAAHPLNLGAFTFYQNRYGYAPAFRLLESGGRETARFIVALETVGSKAGADQDLRESKIQFRGAFALPRSPYEAAVQFYPDLGGMAEAPELRSYVPRNPGLWLEVHRGNAVVYRGLLKPGKPAAFEGYSLYFDHLRHWYGFMVVQDPGIPAVYAGFFVATLGLLCLYVMVPREVAIRVRVEDGKTLLDLSGRSERFPALFHDEITDMERQLIVHFEHEVAAHAQAGDPAPLGRSELLRG